MSDDAIEWFPAAVMRPMAGRSLELLVRGDARPHRGTYRQDRYVIESAHPDVEESDVLSWRYIEAGPSSR